MQVFISYGRTDAAELAVKLAAWLRARGYEPWLDVANGVPIGAPFDVRIETGIAASDVVVALLSPSSLRSASFCRNELLYAQALRVPVIPVRVADVVPPIQIISFNYLDAWPDPEGAFYRLPPVIERVATSRTMPPRDWAAEPGGAWWAGPQPLDFHEELARHGGLFVGREWLFVRIREWIGRGEARLMLLTAGPGVGKSAIAAQMTARLNVKGVHFCARSNVESCRPAAWFSALVYQLAAQFPAYRRTIERLGPPIWEDPPESVFRKLITDPLRRCQDELRIDDPWIFVVDGLDESVAVAGPALADVLADSVQRIPDWLRLFVTSRPDQTLMARFRIDGVERLQLDTDEGPNCEDVSTYVERRLEQMLTEGALRGEPRKALRLPEAATGNFLFAKMTLDALIDPDADCRLNLRDVGKLPANLGGLYHAMFAKRFPDADAYDRYVRPLLDCLVAARSPIPEEILMTTAGAEDVSRRKGLILLSQFIEHRDASVQVFHQSLIDWLVNPQASAEFGASLQNGHRRLADACWTQYRAASTGMSHYAAVHLPVHLAEVGRWDELIELFTRSELRFLTRWVEGGEGEEGLRCLTGLVGFLRNKRRPPLSPAGLATQVARIYIARGGHGEAETWLKLALSRASRMRERRARAIALHELGSLHLYRGLLQQAEQLYRQAFRLCRWGVPPHRDELAANLIGLATVAQIRCDWKRGIGLAVRAVREAKRALDPRHVIAGERLVASACKSLGRYPEAEAHLQSAISLSEQCGAGLERARLLLLRGYLLSDLALLEEKLPIEAQQCFDDALTHAQRVHHSYCVFEAKIGLGWHALAMGAAGQAMTWFDEVKERLPGGRLPELHAALMLGLAAVSHQLGQFDSARTLYRKVLHSCEERDERSTSSKAYVGLGAIAWHMGEREQAETAWTQALRAAESVSPARRLLAEHSIRLCQRDPRAAPR